MRFTIDEMKRMYTQCEARDENPIYAQLARRIRSAIQNNTMFRLKDILEADYLAAAMFSEDEIDIENPEYVKFVNKLYNKNKKRK